MERFKNSLMTFSANKITKYLVKMFFTLILIMVTYGSHESLGAGLDELEATFCIPIQAPNIVYTSEVDTFSEQKLIDYLVELNVKYPHIVLAQAKLETNNFTSDIFRENHNLFGMKEASVRAHTALGTKRGHAYYSTWRQSVLDYALYQTAYMSDYKSETAYFTALGKSYAEDKHYVALIKHIIRKAKLKEVFV